MTRTKRVAGSVALSLMSQVVAMVVGLWLTRFILDKLGQHSYGLWLIILQALGWLALADLGVVGLLPRQTAFATGKDAGERALSEVVGRGARLVLWQWPVVLLLCAAAWLLAPLAGAGRDVLGLVLVLFALAFPVRIFTAVLQGLQDLVFLGWLQFVAWLLSSAVAVTGLLGGLGLYALALSWGVLTLLPPLVAWRRLATKHPQVRLRSLPRLTWFAAREYLGSALWVSIGQWSNVLVAGADVLIIGFVMGPAAVVPYVLTLKLITVIGNFPVALAHSAGPGLSQMRAGESRHDLRRATAALSTAVLAASSGVACIIIAVNEGFVGWWVGADQYAGAAVTLAGVALLLVGHYGATVVYIVFSFGHERRLALTGIVQGVLAAALSVVLVKVLGPVGAVLGGLLAALAVLPALLPTLAADTGTTVAQQLTSLLPFVARLALALAAAATIGALLEPRAVGTLVLAGVASGAVWAALVLPMALRPPLREYIMQLVEVARARLGWGARRPPVPPVPSPPAA